MIRYNLLALLKRSLDYETIGGLFKDVYTGAYELTVVEKIWLIIVEGSTTGICTNCLKSKSET